MSNENDKKTPKKPGDWAFSDHEKWQMASTTKNQMGNGYTGTGTLRIRILGE